ncbi:hypothetical protein [Nonomuraea longicatena]|uniref:Uncharacterized protein n=1 Tax=Nonomuraea longicatena TaxID=83682 RepID=A0ABP4AJH1_9ACTN
MTVFACARCDTLLTAPVSRVALPVHARQVYGHELIGVLMESGTYAVDPEPFGPPWRPWAENSPEQVRASGVHAPVFALSHGPREAIVIAPGDVRGTVLIPERCSGRCCGPDGRDGPNLACTGCGTAVASRIDDCGSWQAVWLDPRGVRALPVPGPALDSADWDELRERWPGTPPVERSGWWSPLWAAAVGAALAHALAASNGTRITVPAGLLADFFGRSLDALLPQRSPARPLALAGPGVPAVAGTIALTPRHPHTGEIWQPAATRDVVPLDAEVWTYLVSPRDRGPAAGGRVAPKAAHQVYRDDLSPFLPILAFRPDRDVFLDTLVRLPQVRRPWLRAIYDRVQDRLWEGPF